MLKSWQPRFFVLYRNSMELRYYGSLVDSRFGALPLDERGARTPSPRRSRRRSVATRGIICAARCPHRRFHPH